MTFPKTIHGRKGGFTLVELMVSMAILAMLLLVLASLTNATQRSWTYTSGKIEEFRNAREAFESITRKLGQATLNTYWDYLYPNGDASKPPTGYVRQSELRFICGPASGLMPAMQDANGNALSTTTHAIFFQAPLGYTTNATYTDLKKLLNTCGYFVEFGSDQPSWPTFLQGKPSPPAPQPRYRFRLMELMEPSEWLTLYNYTSGTSGSIPKNPTYTGHEWFTTPLAASPRPARVVAENIVALVLQPKLSAGDIAGLNKNGGAYSDASLAPNYNYDSTAINSDANINPKNQLPPVVQVTMVALDENSANRMTARGASNLAAKLGTLFADATKYDADLRRNPASSSDQSLEKYLIDNKINYRIFTTSVSLKGAKWSRSQKN